MRNSPQMVDFYSVMDPLFRLPGFIELYYGALRNLDYSLGCSTQCPICYLDVPQLSALFTTDSLLRAFQDDRLQALLACNIRPGVMSDPGDHPDLVALTEALLPNVEKMMYNTSIPPGSEGRLKDLLSRMVMKGEYKRYPHPSYNEAWDSTDLGLFEKFCIVFALKHNNKDRFHDVLGQEPYLFENEGGDSLVHGYKHIGVNDYFDSPMVAVGRVNNTYGQHMISPGTDPDEFDAACFPHVAETLYKGKFILRPDGAYIARNVTFKESHTGRQLIRITSGNYRELAMRYLIEDPNPLYINCYKENPFYQRKRIDSIDRMAVLGYVRQ